MDTTLDQSMNIGTEVRLSEGCTKSVKIGSIKLIREIRQLMKGNEYKFSYSIGRDKWDAEEDRKEIDWPKVETVHKEAFRLVLVEGLTEEEYENVDEQGIEVLDKLLERFL
ncbi:hypothetical protein OB236_38320 [Paenibacillus sp. WQ 127069]|uniref:Uncharacterized protein n=1 Tax=Paenibacillus baimaensis TaxID=2982185 RepID=A0ABT2UW31_9BACL|nr:hypothetical protein [Paenibacillus sp. WQ 127069]MCU6797997.1 hypothetical protein [Paenibacillus sp. WQ 127069]